MKRSTGVVLAGLAAAGGAAVAAGVRHNRRPDRREHLYVTLFAEPGFVGRNQQLEWRGGGRHEVVARAQLELPSVGSVRLERLVYRFQPQVRPPNPYFLWHAVTDRRDRHDPEEGLAAVVAVNQLARMLSFGYWERVSEPAARSGVRLWAARPGKRRPADGDGNGGGTWHDVMADTPDLGAWGGRTRYLELGYLGADPAGAPRAGRVGGH